MIIFLITFLAVGFLLINLFGPGYSSDNSGDGPNQAEEATLLPKLPQKRKTSLSRGQFQQRPVRKRKLNLQKSEDKQSKFTNDYIIRSIFPQHVNCCHEGGDNGCFLKNFPVENSINIDFTTACESFRSFAIASEGRGKEKKSNYAQQKFLECSVLVNGLWERRDTSTLNIDGFSKPIPVCRKVYMSVHGLSPKHHLFKIGQILKNNDGKSVLNPHHIPYADDHIPDYTYLDADKIFKENAPDSDEFMVL